jgi:hypothetical protein
MLSILNVEFEFRPKGRKIVMAVCNHMWEVKATANYSAQATSHSYRCAFCGAETTADVVVERMLSQLRSMEDGDETSVGDMLMPDKYSYDELMHLSMLLSQKAKSEGITLDTGEGGSMFVQYYENFKKRSRKRIVIKRVGKKSGLKYQDGDLVVETIDLTVFGQAKVEASFVFCCEAKHQVQHTADLFYDTKGPASYGEALGNWIKNVQATHQPYKFVGNVVDRAHYGKSIVMINDVYYLMESNDPAITELETMIAFDEHRKRLKESRNSYIGFDYDNPPKKKKKGSFFDSDDENGKVLKADTGKGGSGGGSTLADIWKKLNQPIGKK